MTHRCHAHDCNVATAARTFACRRHWRAIRPELRAAIWREYRAGQERDKRPSLRYLAVTNLALAELVFRPHSETAAGFAVPYFTRALFARSRAITKGFGDPLEGLISVDDE